MSINMLSLCIRFYHPLFIDVAEKMWRDSNTCGLGLRQLVTKKSLQLINAHNHINKKMHAYVVMHSDYKMQNDVSSFLQ